MFKKIFGKRGKVPKKGFSQLWNDLVPEKGQAETIQGELVRCLGGMSQEFLSNGCANWDDGYEIMSGFLLMHLTDGSFGEITTKGISSDIEAIRKYGRGESISYDLEGAMERLEEVVVDWCNKSPKHIKHEKNNKLQR